jgi:hypothetical protein
MLAGRSRSSGALARRRGRDAAKRGDFQRRGAQVVFVAFEPGDEFKDVTLRFAAEAVPDVALQVDLARRLALAMERAQQRALRASAE